MNDKAVLALIRTTIAAGLVRLGQNGWRVARKFQARQQGANTVPTVYVVKIGDKNHGSPSRKYQWDTAGQKIDAEEKQAVEATFQASVMLDEDPADVNGLTPSDGAHMVAAILQSDEGLAALRAGGVGILRIGAVSNPYNVNDRGQYDADASIDFVLTYSRGFSSVAPAVESVNDSINRV